MKKFFKEFAQFIRKGNIVDMAIGVIIGSAFSAIVTALTNKIIMPFINLLLLVIGAGDGLSSCYTYLKKSYLADGVTIDLANSIYIDWGAFITAVINFFIIAFTLFVIMKVAMKSNQLLTEAKDKIDGEYKLTKADKKEAKERGINLFDFKAMNKFKKEKAEQAKAEAEAKLKAEQERIEAEKELNPTQEDLLKDIRDLLRKQAEETTESKKESKKESKAEEAKVMAEHGLSAAQNGVVEVGRNNDNVEKVVEAISVIKGNADKMLEEINMHSETVQGVADQVKQIFSLTDESVDITSKTQKDMQYLKDEADDVVEMITRFNRH